MIIEFEHLKKQSPKVFFNVWWLDMSKNPQIFKSDIHNTEKYFTIGMIWICGTCNPEHTIKLVKKHLMNFGIDFDADVVGINNR